MLANEKGRSGKNGENLCFPSKRPSAFDLALLRSWSLLQVKTPDPRSLPLLQLDPMKIAQKSIPLISMKPRPMQVLRLAANAPDSKYAYSEASPTCLQVKNAEDAKAVHK